MIGDHLFDIRHRFHLKIRREAVDSRLRAQRLHLQSSLIQASHNWPMLEQSPAQAILNQMTQQSQLSRELLTMNVQQVGRTISGLSKTEYTKAPCVSSVLTVTLRLLKGEIGQVSQELVQSTLETCKSFLLDVLSQEDQTVQPFLDAFLEVVKCPLFKELFYNIALIQYWDDKWELKKNFIDTFKQHIKKQQRIGDDDMAITNAFCNRELIPSHQYFFLQIINQYLGCNFTNHIPLSGLMDAFDALRRLLMTNRGLALDMVACAYISREICCQLQESKQPQLVVLVLKLLSQLFYQDRPIRQLLQKEGTLMPIILNLLSRSNLKIVKQACFVLSQVVACPDVARYYTSQVFDKLEFMHAKFRDNSPILDQTLHVYTNLMNLLKYEQRLQCLEAFPQMFSSCMDNQDPHIKRKTLLLIKAILANQEDSQYASASQILKQKFGVQNFLERVFHTEHYELSDLAREILTDYLDSLHTD